jgi:hypothetical protein
MLVNARLREFTAFLFRVLSVMTHLAIVTHDTAALVSFPQTSRVIQCQ